MASDSDSTILSAEHVHQVVTLALYKEEELVDSKPPEGAMEVDAIVQRFAFNPERIAAARGEIAQMLLELEDNFFKSGGGGISFLNACYDRHGTQWGEHPSMAALFALGQAAGLVTCLLPREMWSALPGGMPYYQIDDEACRHADSP